MSIDVKKIISDLGNTDWGEDNSAQAKAVQLLKGLAFSDEKLSNDFMQSLSDASTKIAKELVEDIGDGDGDGDGDEDGDECEKDKKNVNTNNGRRKLDGSGPRGTNKSDDRPHSGRFRTNEEYEEYKRLLIEQTDRAL